MAPGAKVQASKLSALVTEDKIRTLFEFFGTLDNLVLIPRQVDKAWSIVLMRGTLFPFGAGYEAIVEFQDIEAAEAAVHLTGTLFGGRALVITQMDATQPPVSGSTSRPFTNLTMQQQQQQQPSAQGGNPTIPGNSMIRMGPTIHHPQFNGMPGVGQFPPMYPSPHMTLYNPNILAQQFQTRPVMDQSVDLDKVDSKTVYVGNLPLTATKEQLEEVFLDCGKITRVNIAGKPMHPTRFAFIDFETIEGAKKALVSTDKVIGDRTLRINLPRHNGPLPFMLQQAQMMQAPLPTPPAMDATRAKQKKILIKLVNRGGDPSLLKKLEELEAGKTLSEQEMAELNSSTGTQSREGSPRLESMVDKLTSASSSSRRISRSRSRQRRRSRSRSPERDYYRSSRGSRRRSHSRSRYSRSSRYEEDYARYDYREREREREMGRRSGRSYDEAGRDRERSERERERERGREPEKDRERERERDRDRERHRSSRSGDGEKREKSSREARDSGADVRMKSPEETLSTPDKVDE
ncbi:Protein srek1IP1 [Podila minutissima]|uniref:Protein srek1IP1 n=1 Tax=Podila minutissima TaxID=64525 RepID=A0A9P5VL03_9FUNG|nr:Protein srek1IP1 [Podila minutissima]